MPLTPRQRRFAEEYILDLNATQAAIRAGFSAATANRAGSRLLSNVDIQTEVARLQTERSKRLGLSADRVLEELAIKYGESDSEINRARLHLEFLTEG